MASLGLVMKSTAPSASPSSVSRPPLVVRELTSTTGIRWSFTIYRSAVRPSIRGISRSRVMTSGFACGIFLSANRPSMAVFTTSRSGSFMRISLMSLRMSAESSTTITRILFMAFPVWTKATAPAPAFSQEQGVAVISDANSVGSLHIMLSPPLAASLWRSMPARPGSGPPCHCRGSRRRRCN